MSAGKDDVETQVRGFLSSGNALSACDLAAAALDTTADTPRLRYLYLLSLAATGATQRALTMYPQLAPSAEDCDEDWLALPGRLHKDLAFAGIDTARNLPLAASAYRAAHARTGGAFTAINAASLSVLAGELDLGRALARQVLDTLRGSAPDDQRGAYYWHATRAEALLLLGEQSAAANALRAADPLIRNDLTTRCRTRRQLTRIAEHLRADPSLPHVLALPWVYVFDPDAVHEPAALLDPALSSRIEGSPVFMAAPRPGPGLEAAERLADAGARIHVMLAPDDPRSFALDNFLQRAEHVSPVLGFIDGEAEWRQRQSARMAQGLARMMATNLGTEVRCLFTAASAWRSEGEAAPAVADARPGRRMVGLVFADIVGFSRFADADVRRYWEVAVPNFAATINRFRSQVLLRRTWGDGLHVVTSDAESAAEIALGLVRATREVRAGESGRLGRLEIRVGAHYAPAFQARNRIENAPTFYGSQLSFAARVEPVTPPDTVYVSEPFVAALQLECPGRFINEYAGEIALAKKYGSFRMASLLPAPGRHDVAQLDLHPRALVVGVTGHLGLDAAERQRVRRALLPVLCQRLPSGGDIELLCGFAPGADLVVAETIEQAAEQVDATLSVHALLVADPPEIITQWLRRAQELGDPPSTAAQTAVTQALKRWLQHADVCTRLDLETHAEGPTFQRLGAILAATADVLVAVVRPDHAGRPGGAAEIVSWRRDPGRIPAALRRTLNLNASRELILVDPGTGATTTETGA